MRLSPLPFISLLVCLSAFAQTETIPLWGDFAPGSEKRRIAEEFAPNGEITRVSQPELAYYPAPNRTAPAPALIVCPGGGYRKLVLGKEGVRIAQWFNMHGFSVFVLKYRLNPGEAVQDARRAVRLVRQNAATYHVDPTKIGVIGFSAGGHLSANLALNYDVSDIEDATDKVSARPDFCAPIYGVFRGISRTSLTSLAPPMFLAHAVDDKTVPVEESINLFAELRAKGVPVELHLYEKCGHGFALDYKYGYAASWGDAFILWLKAHDIEGLPPAGASARR